MNLNSFSLNYQWFSYLDGVTHFQLFGYYYTFPADFRRYEYGR